MNRKTKTKVIRLPGSYYNIRMQRPLSKLMISGLVNACKQQNNGIPFGPPDLDGSFSALVARGLIQHTVSSESSFSWFVTDEAVEMLRKLGIEVPYYN